MNETAQHNYFNVSKENLLIEVIKEHYGLSFDSVEIIEYPSIKQYKLHKKNA